MQVSRLVGGLTEALTGCSIQEKSFSSFRPGEWDSFMMASRGSFLGSWRVIRARHLRGKVRLFEFLADAGSDTPRKVAQCALQVTRTEVIFLDRIHIRPTQEYLWDQCFKLVVQRLGPKTYYYGSHWNHEERREIGTVPKFVTKNLLEKQFQIDLIDLPEWADFPAYWRAVSENIRRDYKKAQRTPARFSMRFGLAALRDLPALVRLRAHVMHKNKERYSMLGDYLRHALKLATLGKNGFIATVRINRECYSAFLGTQFGDTLWYNSGGTKKNRHGFGSYLFLTLIERWFSRHPTGKIFMGEGPGHYDPHDYTSGAELYRRKLRVRAVMGVEFQVEMNPSSWREPNGS